jgi:hypothetical protein
MRKLLLMAFFISVSAILDAQIVNRSQQTIEKSSVALVEQQLAAYNTRNIDAFLVPYADSVEFYTFPDQLTLKGKERLRRGYSDFFQKVPDLHCEIKGRLVQGNIVIDKQHLTGVSGKMDVQAIVVYEIEAEKIKKVYFIQ